MVMNVLIFVKFSIQMYVIVNTVLSGQVPGACPQKAFSISRYQFISGMVIRQADMCSNTNIGLLSQAICQWSSAMLILLSLDYHINHTVQCTVQQLPAIFCETLVIIRSLTNLYSELKKKFGLYNSHLKKVNPWMQNIILPSTISGQQIWYKKNVGVHQWDTM